MQRGGGKFGKFSNALEKFRNLCWEVEVGKSKGNVPHLCLFHKDLHVRHGELIWVAYNAVQNMGWGDPTRTWPDCSCQSISLINPFSQSTLWEEVHLPNKAVTLPIQQHLIELLKGDLLPHPGKLQESHQGIGLLHSDGNQYGPQDAGHEAERPGFQS